MTNFEKELLEEVDSLPEDDDEDMPDVDPREDDDELGTGPDEDDEDI